MPNWGQLSPSTKPTARYSLSGVYDPNRKRGVILGGNTSEVSENYVNETWEWNGEEWTQNAGATSAPYVNSFGISYGKGDGVGGAHRVIVFGGHGSPDGIVGNEYHNWLWQYNGSDWSNVTSFIGDPPLEAAFSAMCWFPDRDVHIVHGGIGGRGESILQTKELFLNNDHFEWNDISFGVASHGSQMIYDEGRGDVVLFGGLLSPSTLLNNTYVLSSGGSWSEVSTTNTPSARYLHRMIYDNSLGGPVVFGGVTNLTGPVWSNEAWFLDRETLAWTQLDSYNTPPTARGDLAFWFDSNLNKCFMFGGQGSIFDETWGFITGGIDANQFNFSTLEQSLDPAKVDIQPVGFQG